MPHYDTLIYVGDFNINVLDTQSKIVTDFNALLDYSDLKQVTGAPTRSTGTTSTLIDLILVTSDADFAVSDIAPVQDAFDNDLIFYELLTLHVKSEVTYMNTCKINSIGFEKLQSDPISPMA